MAAPASLMADVTDHSTHTAVPASRMGLLELTGAADEMGAGFDWQAALSCSHKKYLIAAATTRIPTLAPTPAAEESEEEEPEEEEESPEEYERRRSHPPSGAHF